MSQIKYILKNGVKNPSWGLRNDGVFVFNKEKDRKMELSYVPGSKSIWKEENEKEGKQKKQWFTDGNLYVDENDKVLIQYLETHPDYNVHYEKFDPEAKAKAEFDKMEEIEKAKDYLRDFADDEQKMSAIATAIIGESSLSKGPREIKLLLFKRADAKPQEIISAANDPAIEANYIAALAIQKRIVETNASKTAVVWADRDKGVITTVAAGKKPITALAEFLRDDENLSTLQELGKKLELTFKKKETKNKKPASNPNEETGNKG